MDQVVAREECFRYVHACRWGSHAHLNLGPFGTHVPARLPCFAANYISTVDDIAIHCIQHQPCANDMTVLNFHSNTNVE
jgi:hypothetical protein